MKKKPTITIGIPAHNEQANIGYMLRSVLRQSEDTFTLDKIIVMCDGCTDNTAKVAKAVKNSRGLIEIHEDRKRLGKMQRLNQLYSINTSDILITLDADLVLSEKNAINKLMRAFDDSAVSIAVFHQEPLFPNSFIGRVCWAADMFWIQSRMYVNDGDHAHNLQGSASAMRRTVAESVRYPSDLNTDEGYLYVQAKKIGLFKYAYDAKVIYRAPTTIHDFWTISSRAIFYRRQGNVLKYLGKDIHKLYEIPKYYKIRGITTMLIRSPSYTILAMVLNTLVRLFPLKDESVRSKTWEMAQSARRAIII